MVQYLRNALDSCFLILNTDGMDSQELGFLAENIAARYLESGGYEILDKNYRKPWGEIDIIAQKDGVVIFVEVKANKKERKGFEPENRVSPEKLRRIYRAVETYLAQKKYSPEQERQIDIVSITLNQDRGVVKIKHFKNIEM